MNTAGWLLTENGRQPWIVQGLQLTKDGRLARRSSTPTVAISLTVFVLLYAGARGASTLDLMFRYARKELDPVPETRRERPVRDARR